MDSQLSPAANSAVSSAVIDQLARTKGWTRLMSVLLWIGAVVLILAGIGMMAFGGLAGLGGGSGESAIAGIGMGIGMGLIYIILSLIYVYPALKLGKFSSQVGQLLNEPSEALLVSALDQQRAFWKYVGIWALIGIILNILFVVIAIVVGGIGAAASAGGAG